LRLVKLRVLLASSQASTDPLQSDPSLRGRTYAIPFSRVWGGACELGSGGLRGWSLTTVDEDAGVLRAECRGQVLPVLDEVEVRVSLDENALTRVDMTSRARSGKGDFGRNTRRVRRFFRSLDRKVGAGPGTVLDSTLPLLRTTVLALTVLLGCEPRNNPPVEETVPGVDSLAQIRNFQGRVYERDLVFATYQGDSTLLVPFFFSARTIPEGTEREIRGWLARGETWDPFLSERWEGPATGAPWRILPRGPIRLVVGIGDALETVVFQEGARSLEMSLGDLLVEWTGQRAQTFRVHRGSLLLSDHTVDGYVLDLTRAWASDAPPPGDWGILLSGDSLQVVLEDETSNSGPEGGAFSVWARIEFLDRQWEGVRLAWTEVRPFEDARRDVPVRWSIQAPEGDLEGRLTARAPYLEAGEGAGPMLPVDALFEVTGDLTLARRTFPVRGFIRHLQH